MRGTRERSYKDVQFLTELRPFRNYRNIESLERVCDYLKTEFSKCGLETEEQTWMAKGNQYSNIIASYRKNKLKRLIVGAHYDVEGNKPGADDNASAVAGLLETARLVAENKPETDYGIDFVAYSLEEPPFFGTESMGSYVHARSLFERMTPVIGMVCYEMIGYFSDKPGSQKYPEPEMRAMYPDRGNFIMVVGIEKHHNFSSNFYNLMKDNCGIDVRYISLPEDNHYAGLSDHRNYWTFGYKAIMINDTSMLRNKNYHKKSDKIGTLDFEKMTEVVKGCY
ncbi:MAG: M28 family peptidase, partial [Bacteroidales bacterium]|nr:M28 family peptidase [Bacteroidales bacterium]